MFSSIGGPEIILIFIVALLVFGPRRLPEIGRKIGQAIGEIRKATGELRSNVEREIGIDPLEGLQQAGRVRREIISSLSDPIREVAKGTIAAVREAPGRVLDAVREAGSDASPAASGEGAAVAEEGPAASGEGAAVAEEGPAASGEGAAGTGATGGTLTTPATRGPKE